jgi:hypothetical protein
MSELPNKRRRAFWTGVTLCLLGAYALGFGPSCCVSYLCNDPDWLNETIEVAYIPLFAALKYFPALKDAHSAFYGWWLSQIPDGVLNGLFAVVASGFAGTCLWLSLRVFNRRERWATWALVAVVGSPVCYAGSLGPACWWFGSDSPKLPWGATHEPDGIYSPRIYWPIGRLVQHAPTPIATAVGWYTVRDGKPVMIPLEPRGLRYVRVQ